MKIENAIKKLEKSGFKVSRDTGISNRYHAEQENNRYFITFYVQDGEVIIIDWRTRGQEDDSMTDYHAGTFCDNISQAIRLATSPKYA